MPSPISGENMTLNSNDDIQKRLMWKYNTFLIQKISNFDNNLLTDSFDNSSGSMGGGLTYLSRNGSKIDNI